VTIRVGVVLPTFLMEAATALDVAVRSEALGLDGVFAYDHLFPIGRPDRPALPCLPVLGAVARSARWWPGSASFPTPCW
jgi:alkanesulfonate monooxygenase SsuD/methylene tetrahydromethanopterin reductase-like flavin-dependent oxidoreductase (luciferase family)